MASPTRGEASLPYDEIFHALPPLGSDAYLHHIQTARPSELPAEVLVRAFRQLPPRDLAAQATLDRLFRKANGSWEYLGVLVARARRMKRGENWGDYEDLLQDALRRILEELATARGRYAERAWNAFCSQRLIDAWRDRHGRRGERLEPPRGGLVQGVDEDETMDAWDRLSELPPWHGTLDGGQTAQIEEIALRVAEEIEDEFLQAVAFKTWFLDKRPRVSGRKRSGGASPLTAEFPQKSRYQLHRALRHTDSQLAAALLKEPGLQWTPSLRALLEKLRDH